MKIVVDDDEHATILAALRYYVANGQGDPDNRSNEIHDLATNGGDVTSLDADSIDSLCERINCEYEEIYLCTYKGKTWETFATSVQEARRIAIRYFRVPKDKLRRVRAVLGAQQTDPD